MTRRDLLRLLKSCFVYSFRISSTSDKGFSDYLSALNGHNGRLVIALNKWDRATGQLHLKAVGQVACDSTASAVSMGLLCVSESIRHQGIAVRMVKGAKEEAVSMGASMAIGVLSNPQPDEKLLRALGDEIVAYAATKELHYTGEPYRSSPRDRQCKPNAVQINKRSLTTPFDSHCENNIGTRLGWLATKGIRGVLHTDTCKHDCYLFKQSDASYLGVLEGPVEADNWRNICESCGLVGNVELPLDSKVLFRAIMSKKVALERWNVIFDSVSYAVLGSRLSGEEDVEYTFKAFPRTILDVI